MERICALALCLVLSLCSATSPPKIPILTPLNCNETNPLVGLATDLINEDRERGFLIKPFRTRSIYEQRVENKPGGSLYYIDFDAKETGCSVLSGKKWKDCDKERSFHEEVSGECKTIMYINKPWRILKTLTYNCTLGTVPSSTVVSRCPDCPIIIKDISANIKTKAEHMVETFNQESNQTNLFKLDEIERVRTQWVFGQSYFIEFSIKETDVLKTQKTKRDAVVDKRKSLSDSKAHVGFCTGSAYNTPEKQEKYSVSCEIYDPRDDDHQHPQRHGSCDHGKEGAQVEESKDNVGHSEAGAEEVGPGEAGQVQGQSKDLPKKCELDKGKHCGRHRGHRHHCHHPGHHHHHHHHPGHHHDHQSHSHPHDPAHHHHHHHHDHHNHTLAEHGSSSEESTDKQHFKRTKGSVQVFYPDEGSSLPVPTIVQLPGPSKHIPGVADFPNEASPQKTCPSEPY